MVKKKSTCWPILDIVFTRMTRYTGTRYLVLVSLYYVVHVHPSFRFYTIACFFMLGGCNKNIERKPLDCQVTCRHHRVITVALGHEKRIS